MANPIFIGYGIAYFLALCVLMLALVAVYGWGANKMGGLGILGFGAALIGTANMAGNMWFEGFVSPWLAQVAPALLYQPSGWVVIGGWSSYILFTLGWVLFGIASLRAQIFPTAICLAMMVGGIAGLVASPPFAIPLGLTITALGIWLLRTTTVTSETAVRATA